MPRERIPDATEAFQRVLFGPMDRHLREVRERFGVRISARNEALLLEGPDDAAVQEVARRVRRVQGRLTNGGEPRTEEVQAMLFDAGANVSGGQDRSPARAPRMPSPSGPPRGASKAAPARMAPGEGYGGSYGGRKPEPRTPAQRKYVQSIRSQDVVFAIGPAGTGKTYLAVVEAVDALRNGQVRRIVLTRPAVEAGEKLGFLPGDFHAKINPYLRPLYDALAELMLVGRSAALHGRRTSSRSCRSRTCAAARSRARSSSSTRGRTRRPRR